MDILEGPTTPRIDWNTANAYANLSFNGESVYNSSPSICDPGKEEKANKTLHSRLSVPICQTWKQASSHGKIVWILKTVGEISELEITPDHVGPEVAWLENDVRDKSQLFFFFFFFN